MKWYWVLGIAGAAFLLGKYSATIATLIAHRDQIGAAGDVVSGVSTAWTGLENLWSSVKS